MAGWGEGGWLPKWSGAHGFAVSMSNAGSAWWHCGSGSDGKGVLRAAMCFWGHHQNTQVTPGRKGEGCGHT